MFVIKNISAGRFGNKLFYYNNLVQVSAHFGLKYSAPRFHNDDIFLFSNSNAEHIVQTNLDVDSDFLIANKNNKIENNNYNLKRCLGDLFFVYDSLATNKIFEFKPELIPENDNHTVVAIHFRGTDFNLWDPKSILDYTYYLNSIELILNESKNVKFKLFTDDTNLQSYKICIQYLNEQKLDYSLGNINNLTDDFIDISYSDVIISSPSTFSITAGFCGKPNKKIIQSKFWVDYQCNNGDKFWINFNNGGNNNYKKYKLI